MNTRAYLAAALAATFLAACESSVAEPEDPFEALRSATRPFQKVEAAVAAGYAPAGPCVAHPTQGAMGIHYTKPSLVDATVNLREPEVLMYMPTANGGRELVGAEFLVPAAAWDAANTAPPSVLGRVFDDHRAPEARHGTPFPHYDLHVWVGRDNPSGMFAPFNPTMKC